MRKPKKAPLTKAQTNVLERCIVPLTKAQITELKRRIKEMADPRRWVVCSPLTNLLKKRGLYYCVDSGCYTMDIGNATLFKSSVMAAVVGEALDNSRKGKSRAPHMITLVRVDESGKIKK
jgi:hypothetical protein